jgi:hypothetical protein
LFLKKISIFAHPKLRGKKNAEENISTIEQEKKEQAWLS